MVSKQSLEMSMQMKEIPEMMRTMARRVRRSVGTREVVAGCGVAGCAGPASLALMLSSS